MKKTVLRFSAFCALLLAIASGGAHWQRQRGEVVLAKRMHQLSGKQVLFMGGSHVAFGIAHYPNAASRAEPYLFTLEKLKRLRPKVAVVSLSALSLQKYQDETYDEGLLTQAVFRHLFWQLPAEERQAVHSLMAFESRAFLAVQEGLPFLASRGQPPNSLMGLLGWEDHGTQTAGSPAYFRQKAHNAFGRYGGALSAQQVKYLRHLVHTADSLGIKVVLLATPLHPTFRPLIPLPARQAQLDVVQELQRQYRCRWYDFQNLDLPAAYFYDADHLNGLGARRFTPLIRQRLQQDGLL